MDNVGLRKTTQDLYVLTIAEQLQFSANPFVPKEDLLANAQYFFLLAKQYPRCVRQASTILGFKKNYLQAWLDNDFVHVAFGRLDEKELAAMARVIQEQIALAEKVVLSKTVYEAVRQALPHANAFVLRAEFNRMFYSPALKRQLARSGKVLSNRNVVLHDIRNEIEHRPERLARRSLLAKASKTHNFSQGAPDKKDILGRYLDKQRRIVSSAENRGKRSV